MALVVKRWCINNPSFWSCQSVRKLNVAVGNASKAAQPQPVDASGRRRHHEGSKLFLPGATIATIMMLGALHIRRMYEEKQGEDAKRQGREVEFVADWKATFLQMLPLRFISRTWGSLTSLELPLWARAPLYKGWARAFNADLDEASLPLEEYVSLRDFFTRELKAGTRPLDLSTSCLLSPVDGIVLQCGQVEGTGTMIEQVKGFSYSVSSLLGTNPHVSSLLLEDDKSAHSLDAARASAQSIGSSQTSGGDEMKSVHVAESLEASPSRQSFTRSPSEIASKGLFYCVLYLGPGDYHRIHAPTDWDVFYRRHFYGRLFPVNERAVRTIKNLYVANERVVLEGRWSQGFMAMAAVGATNVGSIELKFEPELRTNLPKVGVSLATIDSRTYGDTGLSVKAGEEVAVFNLGSTVVLVFEGPFAVDTEGARQHSSWSSSRSFKFTVENGERIKMGQALGRW